MYTCPRYFPLSFFELYFSRSILIQFFPPFDRVLFISGTNSSGHRRVFIDSSATLWRTMLAVAGFRSSPLTSDLESDMDRSVTHSVSNNLHFVVIVNFSRFYPLRKIFFRINRNNRHLSGSSEVR